MNDKDYKRFMAKVDKTDHQRCVDHGCWMWTASTIGLGYGGFRMNGKLVRAHRLSYEQFKGTIPDGMVVRHQCPYAEGDFSNRLCVNPDHLEIGTQKQNVLEGNAPTAKHAAKSHCPKCGRDYTFKKNGERYCRPCYNAYVREWRKIKSAL